jgi:archaemetzincin
MRRCVFLRVVVGLACASCDASVEREAEPPYVFAHAADVVSPETTLAQANRPERTFGRGTVVLVPLGSFPKDLAGAVATGLHEEFRVEVEHHDPVLLPPTAYYPPRKRYRAEKLLGFLGGLVDPRRADTRVLGLTEVDISTTKGKYEDWGIFGLGELPGRAAVISSKRLRRRARDADHVRFRVVTTAIHEIGHTFGLPHCTEPRCVMQDAHGSIENTDASTGHLGPGCRAKLPPPSERPDPG